MTKEISQSGKKVTVIGLGIMGASLAGVLLTKGFQLTVWNRDEQKAATLVERGAVLASGVAAAIEASPVTIICVSGYEAIEMILAGDDVATKLNKRTLVQVSAVTPKEARELYTWVRERGGYLLNGGIAAWPRQIGTSEAFITVAGDKDIFEQQEELLKALAGNVSHVGEEPGASAVLSNAAMAYLAGNWIGFVYGALICEGEGRPVDEFGQLMEGFAPMLAAECRHMGKVIHDGNYSDPESTIKTVGHDLRLLLQHSREAGLHTALPELAAGIFQRAMEAGYGKEEYSAIIKVLR